MVTEVYRLSRGFPRDEWYALTSQLRRCAVSTPSNSAEGFGRHSTNDYIRFLRMAMGSLCELQTRVEMAQNRDYVKQDSWEEVQEIAEWCAPVMEITEEEFKRIARPGRG